MTLFYLQESGNKINTALNKITERKENNKIILEMPINKKVKDKKIKKIIKKLEKYNLRTVALSENLYSIEKFRKALQAKNINIIDGTYLFKQSVEDIIYYICKNSNIDIEKVEISILTDDASDINKKIINNLAPKVKTLNIITNSSQYFKKTEEYLYNEYGIIVKISNKYKTAIRATNIIINLDFTEEEINKYLIPTKSIIINAKGNVKIKSKRFNGINININRDALKWDENLKNTWKNLGFYLDKTNFLL